MPREQSWTPERRRCACTLAPHAMPLPFHATSPRHAPNQFHTPNTSPHVHPKATHPIAHLRPVPVVVDPPERKLAAELQHGVRVLLDGAAVKGRKGHLQRGELGGSQAVEVSSNAGACLFCEARAVEGGCVGCCPGCSGFGERHNQRCAAGTASRGQQERHKPIGAAPTTHQALRPCCTQPPCPCQARLGACPHHALSLPLPALTHFAHLPKLDRAVGAAGDAPLPIRCHRQAFHLRGVRGLPSQQTLRGRVAQMAPALSASVCNSSRPYQTS